jgi:septal ring-binding cell division protein DamX
VPVEALVERYPNAQGFAKEVNLPLLGVADAAAIPAAASAATMLAAPVSAGLTPVIDGLMQTRMSLTLRSLLLAGFPHDPEFFALGLAIAREWSRRKLRVALVDLDFWHPTVVRPAPDSAEGLVDMLEYGCSFRRVAWELVADRLWLIGPGSHQPDEERVSEHPDWERVSRVLASHVDAALYVAPLLNRPGLTGRLSKRMDGVLLAAAVERIERSDLRDAFLELWGSDAPIIGCVGIAPPAPSPKAAPPGEPAAGTESAVAAKGRGAADIAEPRASGDTPRDTPPAARAPSESAPDQALVAVLEREVRSGRGPRSGPGRRARGLLAAAAGALAIAIVAAGAVWVALRSPAAPRSTRLEETLPAGTERVVPAEIPAGSLTPVPETAAPSVPQAPPARPPAEAPYRVHVASFKSERTVAELSRTLRARGLDAWYEPARDLPGWYRVFVGHYATYIEAQAAAARLLDSGVVDRAHAYPDLSR